MKDMREKPFYITTPIYYANAKPHIGHAYTTIIADILARFHRGREGAFLLTGMDEHGGKIAARAAEEGISPQELVDRVSEDFRRFWRKLEINCDNFIRTTDPRHKAAVQEALSRLYREGKIYKGDYEGLYCLGCESFKSESDLTDDGLCPDHGKKPEKMREETYLLKMAEKQSELIGVIETDRLKISPSRYKKEILSFLRGQKLADLSVSRVNVSWGVPLPFDEKHTSYVWFDAFLNYLTGVGWDGGERAPEIWPADIHLIGKDILRVHATIWPIMLMHLGLPLPREIRVHGHILSGGAKMSKTLGNVISIDEMLTSFGPDATRYLLAGAGRFTEDIDLAMPALIDRYNAELANGLGNLFSRVIALGKGEDFPEKPEKKSFRERFRQALLECRPDLAAAEIVSLVRESNALIERKRLWTLRESDREEFAAVMGELSADLRLLADLCEVFMPAAAAEMREILHRKKAKVLFQRVNKSN
ncbi:MAG TPA: methionine--tRNA ligase [Candidatus Moranbacteria bacterium]|nr:methionine--tRNA ligase [Candidatus Moranbacteria bacterium]